MLISFFLLVLFYVWYIDDDDRYNKKRERKKKKNKKKRDEKEKRDNIYNVTFLVKIVTLLLKNTNQRQTIIAFLSSSVIKILTFKFFIMGFSYL
jgi:hypothetical protein